MLWVAYLWYGCQSRYPTGDSTDAQDHEGTRSSGWSLCKLIKSGLSSSVSQNHTSDLSTSPCHIPKKHGSLITVWKRWTTPFKATSLSLLWVKFRWLYFSMIRLQRRYMSLARATSRLTFPVSSNVFSRLSSRSRNLGLKSPRSPRGRQSAALRLQQSQKKPSLVTERILFDSSLSWNAHPRLSISPSGLVGKLPFASSQE